MTIKEKLDALKKDKMYSTLKLKHENEGEGHMTAIGFEVAGKVGEEHILVGVLFRTDTGIVGTKIPLDACVWVD